MSKKKNSDHRWKIWYWVLLIFLILQILFYYAFTQYWS